MKKIISVSLCALLVHSLCPLTSWSMGGGMEEESLFAEIPSVMGTLTQTEANKSPVAVTTITEDMIAMSPGRNLMDVMETFVPDFTWFTGYDTNPMALRGIEGRNYSFMLLVNGHVMNQTSHAGAITELENWDMNDVQKVEVIRGPGSVTYGPGAIAGVISITTKSYATSKGARMGAKTVSSYNSNGAYASTTFEKGSMKGYAYGSVTSTAGQWSPDVFAAVRASDAGSTGWVPGPTKRYFHDFRNAPQMKYYLQLDFNRNWSFWSRYTNNGQTRFIDFLGFSTLQGSPNHSTQTGVNQAVFNLDNNTTLNDKLSLKSSLSHSWTRFQRLTDDSLYGSPVPGPNTRWLANYVQNDSTLKSTLNYHPAEKVKTAVGLEYTYSTVGTGLGVSASQMLMDEGYAFMSQPGAFRVAPGPTRIIYGKQFGVDNYAALGEVSWDITPSLTFIGSDREDQYRYAKLAHSPRASLIFDDEQAGTIKFTAQRSQRVNTLLQLIENHKSGVPAAKPESMQGYELSYGKKVSNVKTTLTTFYNVNRILGFTGSGSAIPGNVYMGKLKLAGVELEAEYKAPSEKWTLGGNHTFIKPVGFTRGIPANPSNGITISGGIASTPVNFPAIGSDRYNWPDQQTKLFSTQKVAEKWKLFESMRVDWGEQGNKDLVESVLQRFTASGNTAVGPATANIRRNKLYDVQVRVDASVAYQWTKAFSLTLLGQNIAPVTHQYRYMEIMSEGTSGSRSDVAIVEPTTVALKADYKFGGAE